MGSTNGRDTIENERSTARAPDNKQSNASRTQSVSAINVYVVVVFVIAIVIIGLEQFGC